MSSGTRPLRVLHVTTGLGRGGAEHVLARLLERGAEVGLSGDVVSLTGRGAMAERIEASGARVVSLGLRWPVPGPRSLRRLARAARALDPDVVQGWMYHGNLGALATAALAPGWPPVAWNIRQSLEDPADEKRTTRWALRAGAVVSRRAALILYNARTSAAHHARMGYDPERSLVIPNGFDTERFAPSPETRAATRSRLGISEDALLVGHIARFHPMKGHGDFVRAAGYVARTCPGTHFVVAGTGVAEAAPRLLAGSGEMAHSFHVAGELEDVRELLAALDVLCLSSVRSEGFPNIVGEAMACGVACVATDVGDTPWLLGEGGVIVAAGDPAALGRALRDLVEVSPSARRRMGACGRQRVIDHFSLDQMVRRYLDAYRMLVRNGAGVEGTRARHGPE